MTKPKPDGLQHVTRSLEQMVLLLSQNIWVYNFKLTRFLLDKVWEQAPKEWSDVLQTMPTEHLSGLPFGQSQTSWPPSLKQLVQDCLSLSIPRNLVFGDHCKPSQSGCQQSQTVHCQEATQAGRNPDTGAQLTSSRQKVMCGCRKPALDGTESRASEFCRNPDTGARLSSLRQKVMCGCRKPSLDDTESRASELTSCTEKIDTDIESEHSELNQSSLGFHKQYPMAESSFGHLQPLHASQIDGEIKKGMSDKKLHEVCHMTSLIDHVTKRSKCNAVVDVGSGLGYLGQVLHTKFDLPVLGLEGKLSHTSGAEKRVVQNSSCPFLHNVTCELHPSEESVQELQALIKDWFQTMSQESSRCCHRTGSRETTSRKSKINPESEIHSEHLNLSKTGSHVIASRKNNGCHVSDNHSINDVIEGFHEFTESCRMSEKTDTVCDKDNATLDTGFQVPNQVSLEVITKQDNVDVTDSHSNCDTKPSYMTSLNDSTENLQCSHTQINTKDFDSKHPNICMVGLHCCGDLTPTMLKCFQKVDCVRSLCCVSCCYHRMNHNEHSGEIDNFPMSSCLKDIIDRLSPSTGSFWNPGLYGLRLAAQETRARWQAQTAEDHDFHTRNVAYRALLEVCLETGNFCLKKTSRKLAHARDFRDFTTYLDSVSKHILIPDTEEKNAHLKQFQDEMRELYVQYQSFFSYIEPVTALQVLLQPVIETLIYKDRRLWLLEKGINCDIVPVFDEFMSPRNLALVAIK